jgi:hypothetical protein
MLATLITSLQTGWRKFLSELTDPYRPELHYMRGPGPKYRAKYDREALRGHLPKLNDVGVRT